MTDKKPMPAWTYVTMVAYHASLWAYPVAEGGTANLSAFTAWGLAIFSALTGVMVLFMPNQESKYKDAPKAIKLAARTSVIGAIAWLAYHGAFALSGLVLFVALLMLIYRLAKRAETS